MNLRLYKLTILLRKREYASAIIILFVLLIVVPLIYSLTTIYGQRNLTKSSSSNIAENESFVNGIAVFPTITQVDPIAFTYKINIGFIPSGNYSSTNYIPELFSISSISDLIPSVPITLNVNGIVTQYSSSYPVRAFESVFSFYSGSPLLYPFDQYNSSIVVSATDSSGHSIPIGLYTESQLQLYIVRSSINVKARNSTFVWVDYLVYYICTSY